MLTKQRGIYIALFICHLFTVLNISAQHKITIKGRLENEVLKSASISFIGKIFPPGTLENDELYASVENNRFALTVDIDETEVAFLYLETEKNIFSQPLYLAKGYQLELICTVKNNQLHIKTSGTGANDNQRLIVPFGHDLSAIRNRKDSTPAAIYQELRKLSTLDSIEIENYIQSYNPSEGFKTTWRLQYQYNFVLDYYQISESRKRYIPLSYAQYKSEWEKLKHDLLSLYPVMNEQAYTAKVPAYFTLLTRFINSTKDSLQDTENISTNQFIQEWFAEEIKRDGLSFRPDSDNLLTKKVIEKFFSGKIKHYLYANLFNEAFETTNPINLENIYKDYAAKYPDSKYLHLLNAPMQEMFSQTKNNFTKGMKFIDGRDTINTFKQLLQIVKGKTILLDMWGTWCKPCREDIKKHSAAIKEHFNNKPLDYLYVANFDEGNEKGWKELISFFKLEGYHILANRKLTQDIMSIIKGNGYPSYAIIRSDGSIELSKTQYPMNREILIQQIDNLLK